MSAPVALVTGAGGGIGRAIVAALAEAGWTVTATDLPGVGEIPGAAQILAADLRGRAACRSVVDAVVGHFGRLDLLVNNAATMTVVEPTQATMSLWWRDIDVNLTAPLWLTQAAAPALRAAGGQVVNICSISGLRGEPGFSAYAASKAGLLGMTRSLARELAPDVRVNAIAPGPTETEQLNRDAEFRGVSLEQLHLEYTADMPIGRLVQPADVADVVRFLAGASAFTGECVQINGGMLMS
ncbi:SDR family NAD(P)-dependent oxidoreductase [Mycolicibacterium pallens]|uniref:SDR family oxidoreductase n=1 Tax=Mycolicibacterium pallens TaxID=370524 RepID=A0ABX8VEA0_9MYCO|nr:SDR family oxidoreductase [Mycolicibacterium pallens]QYL16110.1 SDR family oxidoreductase [Mycolicibacterium pallens]